MGWWWFWGAGRGCGGRVGGHGLFGVSSTSARALFRENRVHSASVLTGSRTTDPDQRRKKDVLATMART